MRSKANRICCLVLMAVLFLMCVTEYAIPVSAAFENTYENTGDQRADLVGVALTQVGYREGDNNYTKYGEWYGAPHTAWCGVFVSWCANQAGIPTSVLKRNGFANASAFGLSAYYASERTPRSGDLFFKTDGSHTGIVYYVEGDYFYTVEGNTDVNSYNGVGVFIRKRSLYDGYYFGAPNYQSESGHKYVRGVEEAHPHKEYYACSESCESMYYTGAYGAIDDCVECKQATCEHSFAGWVSADSEHHTGTCTLCGKQTYTQHKWGNDKILTEATCENVGSKWQKCTQCDATQVAEIPQTNDHQYAQWEYVDEALHSRVCETCGREREESHTVSQWMTDNTKHWGFCDDCGAAAQVEAHSFPEGCESACEICEFTLPTGHQFSKTLTGDEYNHWSACSVCDEVQGKEEHIYSYDCDESCDTCGYVRETTHTFSDQWTSDESGHWYACEICGKIQEILLHVAGAAATETQAQICTDCHYEIVPALNHIHTYEPYSYDGSTHWGTCKCGQELTAQGHIWNMQSGKCSVCQASVPEQTQPQIPWLIILPAVAATALITAIVITVVVIRKKRKLRAAAALQLELEEAVAA